jgi:flagellar basal body-associated protein FliL
MIRNFLDWLRTAPTEKRQKALILLALGAMIFLAAIVSTVVILRAQKPGTHVSHVSESEKSPADEEHSKGPYDLSYEINQISMAVMNRKGTKTAYAQFSLVLDCPDEESHKTLSMNRAKLLDAIFVVGGGFYLEDFQGEKAAKSFEKFKKDLLQKYETDFHAQAPREISLKDWFIN